MKGKRGNKRKKLKEGVEEEIRHREEDKRKWDDKRRRKRTKSSIGRQNERRGMNKDQKEKRKKIRK